MSGKWVLNPDYDGRAAFNQAVLDLLKLDARGCEIVARVAEAINDYAAWDPVEPWGDRDYDRASDLEQIDAFQEVYKALVGDTELPFRLAPLARSRQVTQQKIEADQQAAEAACKRRLRRIKTRSSAPIVRLMPKPPSDGEEGDGEE